MRMFLVRNGMEGGGGLSGRRHSYGGHRVEPWKACAWVKNGKQQLDVKRSRCTWALYRQKQVQCALH